jgi:hypothetical protein
MLSQAVFFSTNVVVVYPSAFLIPVIHRQTNYMVRSTAATKTIVGSSNTKLQPDWVTTSTSPVVFFGRKVQFPAIKSSLRILNMFMKIFSDCMVNGKTVANKEIIGVSGG